MPFNKFGELMAVDRELWRQEAQSHNDFFFGLHDKLPKEFVFERELLVSRLWRSPDEWQLAAEIEE
jgi:phosphoenolpyruvate carboxykinase (GTP)